MALLAFCLAVEMHPTQAAYGTSRKAKAVPSRQISVCSREEMHFSEAQTSQSSLDDNTCMQLFYLWSHRDLGAEPYLKGAVTAILVCLQGVS